VLRDVLVWALTTVTAASATTAPLASVTSPVMDPTVCAEAAPEVAQKRKMASDSLRMGPFNRENVKQRRAITELSDMQGVDR